MTELTRQTELHAYQDIFMFAEEEQNVTYSAILAAVGTGKTFTGLLKAWNYCQKYPNSLGLIVRREYEDLKNSTIQDFETNFGVKVPQNKIFTFPNGSKIMFSHGNLNDINVLKNINLSFFLIEQGEEYESVQIFTFLCDRLRRKGGPRWGGVIANANGHNWVWEVFVDGAKCNVLDERTGQKEYLKSVTVDIPQENGTSTQMEVKYICTTANTFANEKNLPTDYIAGLIAQSNTDPNHYRQYVMNDLDVIDADDLLLTYEMVQNLKKNEFDNPEHAGIVVAALDVARYGKDLCVLKVYQNYGAFKWKCIGTESWGRQNTMYSVGRVADCALTFRISKLVVDCDGLGAGVYDRLKELNRKFDLIEFHGGAKSNKPRYYNLRAECYFTLRDFAEKGWIEDNDPQTTAQLAEIKYTYTSDGVIQMFDKQALRRKQIKSPDFADTAMMCASLFEKHQFYPMADKRARAGGSVITRGRVVKY